MSKVDISEDLVQIVDDELQMIYGNNLKIVNKLNELEKIIEPKAAFQTPLEVTKNDNLVICELIKVKIKYLKEKLMFDTSIKSFSLLVFETLFIRENELIYDKLEEKLDIFRIILKT